MRVLVILIILLSLTGITFCIGCGEDSDTGQQSADDQSSFIPANYKHQLELDYAITFGDMWDDNGEDVTVDESGNVFIVGRFAGTVDFDPGEWIATGRSNGRNDAFLCKYDSGGNLVWENTWGGPKNDDADDVELDDEGNVYVLGAYAGEVDFEPGSGTMTRTSSGNHYNAYVCKFNAEGDFQWVAAWGEKFFRFDIRALAVDATGNVYLTGSFSDKFDFDPGSGVVERISPQNRDVYVMKLNSDGQFENVSTWGGSGTEQGIDVVVDEDGNVFFTGRIEQQTPEFSGTELIPPEQIACSFVGRLDSSGELQWVRNWGDRRGFGCNSEMLVVDDFNNIYVMGAFLNTIDFDPGFGTDERYSENFAGYVSRFDIDGNYRGVTAFPGFYSENQSNSIRVSGIGVDDEGDIYVAGVFSGTPDFDPGPREVRRESTLVEDGSSYLLDCCFCKFSPDGEFLWVETWGNQGSREYLTGFFVDGPGNVYAVGGFEGMMNFDVASVDGDCEFRESKGEGADVFLLKYSQIDTD